MAETKRKRTRRSFSDEFKAGAVRLVLEEGKTVGAGAAVLAERVARLEQQLAVDPRLRALEAQVAHRDAAPRSVLRSAG